MNASNHPKHHFALWVTALCLQAAAVGSHAAPTAEPQGTDQATATKSKKKSQSVKIKPQQNNSAESPAERDRRLYRECKGMPNAGACLGYTRR